MKRVLKYLGLLLLGIVIALAMVPYLFKDEIITAIEDYANQHIDADLKFEDVSLSLFKSFPNASITINDLSLTGRGEFEGITLFSAQELELETNIKAAISNTDNISVKEFHLSDAEINIINSKSGKANYDIYKSDGSSSSSESSEFTLAVKNYSINSTDISYKDYQSKLIFETKDFNQTGSGNFALDQFDLKTENKIASTSLNMDGIPYLKNTPISGPLELGVDIPNSKYDFKDNNIKIHDLLLKVVGYVDINDNDMMLDLDINSNQGDIRNFLSLIPNVYYEDLPALTTKGNATISCRINGKYDDRNYPALDLKINTKDGYIASSDLPDPIENLNMNFSAKAAQGSWNDLLIDIPNFSLSTLGKPFSGRAKISNVMLDPNIDMAMKGQLDMPTISRLFGGDEINVTSGTLNSDFILLGKQSDFEKENYAAIQFNGTASLTNFDADYYEYKDIVINDVDVNFNPAKLDLNNLSGSLGNSDFNGTVKIENPMSYFITDKKMTGDINMNSNLLDLTPYVEETSNEIENSVANGEELDDTFIRETAINYNVNIKEVKYPDYKIENVRSSGRLSAEKVLIEKSSISLNDQTVAFNGELDNAWDYIMHNETLGGKVNFNGGKIDLNAFASNESAGNSTDGSGAFYLPVNVNTVLTGQFDEVKYEDYELENLKGKLTIAEGIALFDGIAGSVLDGKIKFDGIYDTSDPKDQPKFDMKYDLSQFKWSKTFAAVETFRTLAPVGKFIDGLFNSTLSFSGLLGDDMLPDWNNLSAAGFIHTKDGTVKGLVPIEKVGEQLGIKELQNFKIVDTKNWFEVKDGFVNIKPFDFDVEDMKFRAAGRHSVDQDMDYVIEATIPRERLKKGQIGQAANQGLDFILKEAGKKGVNVDLGDYIYLDIKLTGKLSNPKIKVIPKGSGGKTAKDIVTDKVIDVKKTVEDTIRKEVDKKVKETKDEAIARANEEYEKAKAKAEAEKDKLIEKGKEKVKEKVGTVVDSEVGGAAVDTIVSKINDKAGDIINNEKAKEEIDKMKEKLKKWDPFKKKGGGDK